MQSLSPSARALLIEKFNALLDGSDIVAANATPTQALDDLESFFLIQGRAFIREVFQERFQEYIEQRRIQETEYRRQEVAIQIL